MVGRFFVSYPYVLLAGVVLMCSSCFVPGSQSRPVLEMGKSIEYQREMYGKLPLHFEANSGQTDPQVKFLSRGPGYALFLTPSEAVLTLQGNSHSSLNPSTVIRMQVLGANSTTQVAGAEKLSGKVNYLHGSNPKGWQTDIPTYRKVQYHNVYPGIDLVYYGQQRQLEYDFIIAPGIAPSAIRLSFTDKAGLPLPQTLDAQGNLILHTPIGNVQLHKPFVYQEDHGTRTEIAGSYVRQDTTVGFQIASYDARKPLVIDPKLVVYSTFLGGDQRDSAFALTIDEDHNVYLAGQTLSANFPLTADAVDTTIDTNTGDAFITKLNDTGSEVLFSTYLGGAGADSAKAIAVNSNGEVYVAGETFAPDQLTPTFPTTPDAVQPTAGGGTSDAFVAKLDANGSTLLYSTYLGGEAADRANGLAVDSTGSAYVVGQTLSDFSLADSGEYTLFGDGPIAPNSNAALSYDAFVVKLNPTGTARSYTTVFSGRAHEEATAVAVSTTGEAYVVGFTSSSNFPVTPHAFQRTYSPTDNTSDAFVVLLDTTGTILRYSTYLGGGPGDELSQPSPDVALGVTIDALGNAVVTGVTASPEFPTSVRMGEEVSVIRDPEDEDLLESLPDALQNTLVGIQDAFVSIIDVRDTGSLLYSTYLGGENILHVGAVATDSTDPNEGLAYNIYIGGTTSSTIPTTTCAVQPIYGGGPSDAFISKIALTPSAPSRRQYATYLGGSEKDEAYGFAIDTDLNMYVAGLTQSTALLSTPGSVQPTFGGTEDAFLTKFDTLSHAPCADLRLTMTNTPDQVSVGNTVTYTLTVTNLGPDIATNVTVTDTLPSEVNLLSVTPSTGTCIGTNPITCSMGTLTLTQTNTITIVAQVTTAGIPVNRASVSTSGPDFDENNNTTAVNTSVVSGNSLRVAISNETGASGQVTSRPEGIACPPDCSESFPSGTSVILTATPQEAVSSFRRWGGACAGEETSPFCKLTVSSDLAVEAEFARSTGLAAKWESLTQSCRVSSKKKPPRCRVNGTLRVMNTGLERATKFTIRFFFSDDSTLNAGYTVLKDKKVSGLNAGSEQLINVDLRLPSGVNGSDKFIVAFVDADAQVAEGDEANNRAIFGPLP